VNIVRPRFSHKKFVSFAQFGGKSVGKYTYTVPISGLPRGGKNTFPKWRKKSIKSHQKAEISFGAQPECDMTAKCQKQ